MISSIFYFAETEQEYLDNFNRHQVKPYTIVFCKDTRSLWKNGVRYGGSTHAEITDNVDEVIQNTVTPLINQLNDAIADANSAVDRAEERLADVSSQMDGAIEDLQGAIDAERQRLNDNIQGLSSQIKTQVEAMLGDSQWIEENWPQGVTNWDSGWNESLEAYLTQVGYYDVDPNTGAKTTKWSKLQQQADSIESSVNQITEAGGTLDTLQSSLEQQITAEGAARTELSTQWAQADAQTKDVIEWMYSGLTTEAGEGKTFSELTAAAQEGDHSAISNIMNLVEKIPVQQTDPQTGEPVVDEHGDPVYETDQDGNIVYQTNPDGSYKYRAKASLTSAVDDAISGIVSDTNSDYASTQMLAALGNNFAAWNAAASASGSTIEGIVTHDNFAGELKSVAAEDWAETGIAAKLKVPRYDENGDPMYDEHGDPMYEEISDAIGSIQTRVSSIGGVENVTNTIDARVSSALSTFEQNVNAGTACTTLVNKVDSDNQVLSGLVSKVTGDSSSNSMLSKVNGMTAGVVTTANLENAVAGLVARQEPIITLTATSVGAPPSGALNVYQGQAKALPSEGVPSGPGASLTFTGTSFNSAFSSYGVYHTTISTQAGPQDAFVPLKYVAGESGLSGTTNPYYAISDGEYIWTSAGLTIRINIQDLSGSIFSKVDNKLNTATAGLAAKNYVDGKEASILASIANGTAEIKLTADKLTIDAGDIDAINSKLQINQLVAAAVAAKEVSTNKLIAGADDWATIVDDGGIRIYNSDDGHKYVQAEDDYYYRGGDDYVDKENEPNSILKDNGAGWLANQNIEWDEDGNTHIGPVNTEQGLSVKTVNGSTKIILKGDIVADDLNLKAGKSNPTTYGTGGSKGDRNVVTMLSGYEFSTGLERLDNYNSVGYQGYGDMIKHESAKSDTDDGTEPFSVVDWGAISMVKGGQTSSANVPYAKNSRPRNYSLYIEGERPVPGSALVIKGYDGCGYRGFTGTANGMSYINGIAIGPDVPDSAIYDEHYTFNQNDTYL